MKRLFLKAGKEKSLLRRHPWVFSGAIERVAGEPAPGDSVVVCSSAGAFLAHAAYSPASQIRARVWSYDEAEAIDAGFFRRRVAAAVALRRGIPGLRGAASLRLVHGESDGLPGLVVDRYGDTLVAQFLAAGADAWREAIAEALLAECEATRLYERSDADVRALEGLAPRSGPLRGAFASAELEIEEGGLRYVVDFAGGHKTGFYLDQRDNRQLCRELAHRREVLNCFCYTGGFSLATLAGGATSALSIDSSADALALARRNAALNRLEGAEWLEADVFAHLRKLRDQARRFDFIVLDPPKFAPTAAHAEKAARAYKDINLLAFKLLRPGGMMMSFSCSGGVSADLFQKIVAGAALDARVDARVLRRLGAAADHPVALAFPEGEYLKGLLCQVV